MEAKHATDCAPWKETIDPAAAALVTGAIDHLAEFPVLDQSVQRVIALCDDPDSTAADLVDALERDATFAANLLRFANSAARAHPIRAKTIRQAVMLVGRKALRRLALEAATYRFLERARGNDRASFGQLHVHALSVALLSAAAAEQAKIAGDGIHLGGLLHDVGKLVLPAAFGADACDELAHRHPSGSDRALAERERFGIDHAQCGALLCERWGMAPDVVSLVAWHHGGATGVGAPAPGIACVQLADVVSRMLMGDEPDHALLEVALAELGFDADILDHLAGRVMPTVEEEQGATRRLAQRVGELERLSQTDDLTGLSNRRHWLQSARAMLLERGGGSLVLCDIDHFRTLNDRHGRAAGDGVLADLGEILSRHGHAGRLGGDEFALWIDGGLDEAALAAQRILAVVEETFESGDGPKVDLSISCASAPTHGTRLAELLEAAAEGLTDAKRATRSRAAIPPPVFRGGGMADDLAA